MTQQIENWISTRLAGPDIAECIDMSVAINRALRQTHTPDRVHIKKILALSAPRKSVENSRTCLSTGRLI